MNLDQMDLARQKSWENVTPVRLWALDTKRKDVMVDIRVGSQRSRFLLCDQISIPSSRPALLDYIFFCKSVAV